MGGGTAMTWPCPAPPVRAGLVAPAPRPLQVPAAQLCLHGQVPQAPCAGSLGFPVQGKSFRAAFGSPRVATSVALRKMRFSFFFFFPCILNCRCSVASFLQAAPTHRHTKLRSPPSFPLRCPERSPTARQGDLPVRRLHFGFMECVWWGSCEWVEPEFF